jgi:hypothetical protein
VERKGEAAVTVDRRDAAKGKALHKDILVNEGLHI